MLKIIEEFPSYAVTEDGDIYSYKSNKWLSTRSYDGGYWGVNLRDFDGTNVFRHVHTLVAKAFLKDSYEEGLIVNHKDLDKTNCHVSNLEWVTYKENSDHYVENMPEHASDHRRKISKEDLQKVCELIQDGHSTEDIYKLTKVSKNNISKLRNGSLYSWFTKDYNLLPEPVKGIDDNTAREICVMLENGMGCKAICDKFTDNPYVKKSSVNNIKYRATFEHISDGYTWWVGKYISKSERRKGKTSND